MKVEDLEKNFKVLAVPSALKNSAEHICYFCFSTASRYCCDAACGERIDGKDTESKLRLFTLNIFVSKEKSFEITNFLKLTM